MTSISRRPEQLRRVSETPAPRGDSRGGRARIIITLAALALVFAAQISFGMWMNSRGFMWGDALSRATSALTALHSADPRLAAIGLVWLPLPTLLELAPVAFYLLWPEIVASGLASTLVSALCGTLTAALLIYTARALGLAHAFGVVFALVVAFNPMLFLFSTNGMSEGVAAPFLIGAVACVTLFWNSGQRRYIAAASVALALGFACLYQAVNFGAALFAALVLGILFSTRENVAVNLQGRWRAVEGLGILFLVPSVYVGLIWVGANATIMGDPLYFARSAYSNEGYISSSGAGRLALEVQGDLAGTLYFVFERGAPFLIPIAFLLIVRALEGRLFGINTLSLILLSLSVTVGLMVPQLYGGEVFGWLRYFMYPLFVAAGWSLYEVAASRRRKLAALLVFCGWLLAVPAIFSVMQDPQTGQDEHHIVRGVLNGEDAAQTGFSDYPGDARPVSEYLDDLEPDGLVLLDFANGWPIAATVTPQRLRDTLVLTSDERFSDALLSPGEEGVEYMLVPNPESAPQDLVATEYPDLWAGDAEDFELVRDFPETSLGWKLYRLEDYEETEDR